METMQFKIQGMNRDLALSSFNKEKAYEIYNMRLLSTDSLTTLALTNEKGTTNIFNDLPDGYLQGRAVGAAVLDLTIYIFTHEEDEDTEEKRDRLYSFLITDEGTISVYDSLFNYQKRIEDPTYPDYVDLNLDFEHPLDIIPYFESEDILKLYWIDGKNLPRMFNVVSKNMTVDFLPEVSSKNKVVVEKLEGGGMFPAGVIQYAFTMGVENGQESNIFYTSPLFYLTRDSLSGLPVGEFAKCSFKITFDNIDWGNYDYVIVYSITRTALNGEVDCRRVGKFSRNYKTLVTETKTEEVSETILYFDYGQLDLFGISSDPAELNLYWSQKLTDVIRETDKKQYAFTFLPAPFSIDWEDDYKNIIIADTDDAIMSFNLYLKASYTTIVPDPEHYDPNDLHGDVYLGGTDIFKLLTFYSGYRFTGKKTKNVNKEISSNYINVEKLETSDKLGYTKWVVTIDLGRFKKELCPKIQQIFKPRIEITQENDTVFRVLRPGKLATIDNNNPPIIEDPTLFTQYSVPTGFDPSNDLICRLVFLGLIAESAILVNGETGTTTIIVPGSTTTEYYNVMEVIDTHDSTQETIDVGHLLITCQRNRVVPQTFEAKSDTLFLGNLEINVPSVSEETKKLLRGESVLLLKDDDNIEYIELSDDVLKALFVNSDTDLSRLLGVTLNTQIDQRSRELSWTAAEPYTAKEISVFNHDSSLLKIFKGREYYRLGIQLSNNFGEKTDVIDLGYVQINPLLYGAAIGSYYPIYHLDDNVIKYLTDLGYTKARLMMEEETYENRSVISLGVVSPTMFHYGLRTTNSPYAVSSWFFRAFGDGAGTCRGGYDTLSGYDEMDNVGNSIGEIESHSAKSMLDVTIDNGTTTWIDLCGKFALLDTTFNNLDDIAVFLGYLTDIFYIEEKDNDLITGWYEVGVNIPIGNSHDSVDAYKPYYRLLSEFEGEHHNRSDERQYALFLYDHGIGYDRVGIKKLHKKGKHEYGMYSVDEWFSDKDSREVNGPKTLNLLMQDLLSTWFLKKLKTYLDLISYPGDNKGDPMMYGFTVTVKYSNESTFSNINWDDTTTVHTIVQKPSGCLESGTTWNTTYNTQLDYLFTGGNPRSLFNTNSLYYERLVSSFADILRSDVITNGSIWKTACISANEDRWKGWVSGDKDLYYSHKNTGSYHVYRGNVAGGTKNLPYWYFDTDTLTFHSPNIEEIKTLLSNNTSVKSRVVGVFLLTSCKAFLQIFLSSGTASPTGRCINGLEIPPIILFLTVYPGYTDDFNYSIGDDISSGNNGSNATYPVYPWHRSTSLGIQTSIFPPESTSQIDKIYSTEPTRKRASLYVKWFGVPKTKSLSNLRIFTPTAQDCCIQLNNLPICFWDYGITRLPLAKGDLTDYPIYLGDLDFAYVYNLLQSESDDEQMSQANYGYSLGEYTDIGYGLLNLWWRHQRLGLPDSAPTFCSTEAFDPILIRYSSTPHAIIKLQDSHLPKVLNIYTEEVFDSEDSKIVSLILGEPGHYYINDGANIVFEEDRINPNEYPELNIPDGAYTYIVELYADPIENNRTDTQVAWIPVGDFIELTTEESDSSDDFDSSDDDDYILNTHANFIQSVVRDFNMYEEDSINWIIDDDIFYIIEDILNVDYSDSDSDSSSSSSEYWNLLDEEIYKKFVDTLDELISESALATPYLAVLNGNYTGIQGSELLKHIIVSEKGAFLICGTEGDHFYGRWDCLKTYAYNENDVNQVVDIVSFPLESPINVNARTDRNRGAVNNTVMSPKNFNIFNDVYNQSNNFFTYYNSGGTDNKIFSNEIIWSLTKNVNEGLDNWTNVTTTSVVDLDGTKGKLNKLKDWTGKLLAFLDKAITYIPFDTRSLVEASDGIPIEITNSGKVASSPQIMYDNIGCQNKWSVCVSPSYIYFIDNYNKGIFKLGDPQSPAPVCVSDELGFHSWIVLNNTIDPWNSIEQNNFKVSYDTINKEVYFVNKDWCLVFNEPVGCFTSFYSYENIPYIFNVNNYLLGINNNTKQSYYEYNAEYENAIVIQGSEMTQSAGRQFVLSAPTISVGTTIGDIIENNLVCIIDYFADDMYTYYTPPVSGIIGDKIYPTNPDATWEVVGTNFDGSSLIHKSGDLSNYKILRTSNSYDYYCKTDLSLFNVTEVLDYYLGDVPGEGVTILEWFERYDKTPGITVSYNESLFAIQIDWLTVNSDNHGRFDLHTIWLATRIPYILILPTLVRTDKACSINTFWTGDYNKFFDSYKPYYLTIIANENPLTTKVFNTVTYTADIFDYDNGNLSFNPLLSFDYIEAKDEYQEGSYDIIRLPLTVLTLYPLKKKFRIWNVNIPRDGDSADDIGITTSNDVDTRADRMSNPWIKLTLKRNNSDKAKESNHRMNLHDIVVNYTVL